MIAYKFLAPGAVGPFSRFAWPAPVDGEPGPWVEAPVSASRGIHACRIIDLPYWIDAELWLTELAGTIEEAPLQVVAPRGRLLQRIEGWDAVTATRFATDCALRLRDRAVAQLRASGLEGPAVALAAAGDPGALAPLASNLAAGLEGTPATLVGFVGDAAMLALGGIAAGAAYVAARADEQTGGGPAAFTEERGAQARWMMRTLALQAS